MTADTIFAPATGPGPAGIAIVRVSGPAAGVALVRLSGITEWRPRLARRARLRDADGELLDDALALWFPAPASFTGEDVAELHIHGGRAVVAGVLEALAGCESLRPAEPGEFTRRAFEHGKLDLTAAEGLADLVRAETAAQRRQALRQAQGELARLYEGWRARLLASSARLEAEIDFADEDLPEGLAAIVIAEVAALAAELQGHLEDGRRGERLREGFLIAVVGAPNVGKSSLVNALARRDAAIVSDRPGTTRDVVEVRLDLGGLPVTVADTAGLRSAAEAIEREGVARARRAAAAADLLLAVFDAARWPEVDPETASLVDADSLVVVNKADLRPLGEATTLAGRPALAVSALTGAGLASLLAAVEAAIAARYGASAAPPLTRVRHRRALTECRDALARAAAADEIELLAEEVRLATRALGRITGRVDVEQVLDVVFREFCIGK